MRLDTPARQRELGLSTGSSLTIAALGAVYGDIGTSPPYAVRQSLIDFGDLSERAILGALSLTVWALVLVVTVKYVLFIMRADNRGEGGLLALTALVLRRTNRRRKRYLWIMAAGLVAPRCFTASCVPDCVNFSQQDRLAHYRRARRKDAKIEPSPLRRLAELSGEALKNRSEPYWLQLDAAGRPTSKKCPECLSDVPIAARRCAFCTSSIAQPT